VAELRGDLKDDAPTFLADGAVPGRAVEIARWIEDQAAMPGSREKWFRQLLPLPN
jgi:hypothetical protein